jgi:hypothetical protein
VSPASIHSPYMKRFLPTSAVLLTALTLASPPLLAAQQVGDAAPGQNQVSVIALELTGGGITLDGRIDEDVWADAVPITDFTQQEPVEGAEPSQTTEIRVAFDDDNLYIGAILYDDPEGVLATQRQRDGSLFSDDRLSFILDTFLDGRTGYRFEVNPAGAMVDGLLSGGGGGRGGHGGPPGGGGGGGGFGGSSNAWDGIWEARTQRRPDGWSAEIRIPFQTLNFDPDLGEWGINFQRSIRRLNEEILWRGFRRNQGLQNPVFAGRLRGLRNLSQGFGLEAVPAFVGNVKNVPCADAAGCASGYDPTTFPYDLSLDVNYSVTSSLRASASVNTDFAEVESDQRQVNLTRFALRFPELRDFFLEGAGVFDFAARQQAQPFYSRNIGLDAASGQQLPILYGTRLTGQVGSYEVGFYQIGTANHTYFSAGANADVEIPREDFTVARVKRRIWEQSSVGFMYTRRSSAMNITETGTLAAHTAGVDVNLSTRHFLGDQNLGLEAFVAWNSDLDDQSSVSFSRSFHRLSARGIRVDFPNDPWSASVSYREFGDDYDPSLGFVTRSNFRRLNPRINWSPRPESIDWIRSFNFGASLTSQWQLSGGGAGRLEQQDIRLDLFSVNFESGDRISFSATRTDDYLDFSFPISSGITLLPGDYQWWEYQVFASTAPNRKAGFFGSYSRGGFWNGDRNSLFGGLNLRPSAGFNLRLSTQRNNVSLPAGDFQANVYGLTSQWTPTPWVAFTNQIQYDDVSEVVGLFLRLRWIVRPGNDVFLVYTHNWQNLGGGILEDPQLRTLSNGGSVKLNYTYRL